MTALLLIALLSQPAPAVGDKVQYRPFILEDLPRWTTDPLVWESGKPLHAIVSKVNADGTLDVDVLDANGWHVRQGQRVLKGMDLYFGDGGSGVVP